jgi:acetylornithine/N-succinyldiaminopimelate aminotransferase
MGDAMMGVYNREPVEAGGGDNCVRLLPPLMITADEADLALDRLAMAFATTRRRMAHAA